MQSETHQCQIPRGDISTWCMQSPACLQTHTGSPEKVKYIPDTPSSVIMAETVHMLCMLFKVKDYINWSWWVCTSWATIECSSSSSGAASLVHFNSVHSLQTNILGISIHLISRGSQLTCISHTGQLSIQIQIQCIIWYTVIIMPKWYSHCCFVFNKSSLFFVMWQLKSFYWSNLNLPTLYLQKSLRQLLSLPPRI